jgi:hypothetical protein
MGRKQISVQADRAYVGRFQDVAKALRDAGMTVQDELASLGHFRGVVDNEKVEELKMVPGVAAVEVLGDEGEQERDEYSILDDER